MRDWPFDDDDGDAARDDPEDGAKTAVWLGWFGPDGREVAVDGYERVPCYVRFFLRTKDNGFLFFSIDDLDWPPVADDVDITALGYFRARSGGDAFRRFPLASPRHIPAGGGATIPAGDFHLEFELGDETGESTL